jgi:hypothetical protein
MTTGLTWRRTARRIKRLKDGVLTISPDYQIATPDFLALSDVVGSSRLCSQFATVSVQFFPFGVVNPKRRPPIENEHGQISPITGFIKPRPQSSFFQ